MLIFLKHHRTLVTRAKYEPRYLKDAVVLFDHRPQTIVEYVEHFITLKEFGFGEEAIKEALVMTEGNREAALDFLTNQANKG